MSLYRIPLNPSHNDVWEEGEVSHQAEIATVDVLERDQPVTYQAARCTCGWRSAIHYVTARVVQELEAHLSEEPGDGLV